MTLARTMFLYLVFLAWLLNSYAFLLDSSTGQPPANGLMTDDHYDFLLKLYMDERNARRLLQQYVIQQQQTQQQQNAVVEALKTRLEQLEHAEMANTTEIENKYTKLAMDYKVLKHDHIVLESKFNASENRTHVALTAFGTRVQSSNETRLQFPDIKYSSGLTQLSTFRHTGLWTCEKSGLYLLSVTIEACSTRSARFFIFRNKNFEGDIYIGSGHQNNSNCASGSGTLVLHLSSTDTISIEAGNSVMQVFGERSIFTIIEIK